MAEPSYATAPAEIDRDAAERFATHVAPTLVKVAQRLVDLAELEPGNAVLDLCTSTGLAAFLAAERVGREGTVIGLDRSQAMLDVARERSAAVGYDYIHWQQGEAVPLRFADESFDAVLCLHGLAELQDPFAALEEARRVLVEHGRLAVTIWSGQGANEWLAVLHEAFRRALPTRRPPNVLQLAQPGNLEALLQASGFQQVESARLPDMMRFQSIEAFWQWARAIGRWGATIAALEPAARARLLDVLHALLEPRMRRGELVLAREIVYARAVAPPAL